MITLLPSLVLALQVPVQAQQAGKVSGVLKDAQGKPITGIRMAALARPETLDEAITSPAMSSLAETDEQGRYTLESIPPGRYFIAAGRLDVQTYYPGTADLSLAKEVAIAPGSTVSGIDFTLSDSSFGRASNATSNFTATIPLRVTVEGGGKMPVSANGKFVTVKLDMATSVITAFVTNTTINVPGPQTTAYRVTVEDLPETFVVKSIMYGTTDLMGNNTLRLTPSNFPASVAASMLANVATQVLVQTTASSASAQPGAITMVSQPRSQSALQTPPSPLYITLAPVAPKPVSGARVSGRMSVKGNRTIFVSGIPAMVYSDGTFDAYGIPPGRHSIVSRDNPSGSLPLAASVVAETGNLEGIVLVETAVLPVKAWEDPPRPAAGHPAGSVPLARISGTLVEELSKDPIPEGTVMVKTNGYYTTSFDVDNKGHFELPPLLPGRYDIDIQIFGHSNVRQSIEIDDKDLKIEFVSRKLY